MFFRMGFPLPSFALSSGENEDLLYTIYVPLPIFPGFPKRDFLLKSLLVNVLLYSIGNSYSSKSFNLPLIYFLDGLLEELLFRKSFLLNTLFDYERGI